MSRPTRSKPRRSRMRPIDGLLALAFGLLLTATAAQAGWQDTASPADVQRLSKLDEAKAKALGEAQAGPDMDAIRAVLDPAPASGGALAGRWRCRTIKLGGMTPSVVYSWFSCRIADRGGHLFFETL